MVNLGRRMNKLAALILSIAALVGVIGPAPAGATPVTWSFHETAITSCDNPGNCVLPPQPFVFMTLALPGPTSNGTATWLGTGSQPVYTGDSFTLMVPFTQPLTPAFAGDASQIPAGTDCSNGFHTTICDFNISWSEVAGVLTSISINIDAVNDNIGGLAGPSGFHLRVDHRTAPRFGQCLGALTAQLLHARSDGRKVVSGTRSGALAAQLPHASADHRKIVGGAGAGHVSSIFL